MGKPAMENMLLAAQADTQAWYGRSNAAREMTRRATDSAQHNDAKERAAAYQAEAALREVEFGNREQARTDAEAAMKLAPNSDVRTMAALALARAGGAAGGHRCDERDYWLVRFQRHRGCGLILFVRGSRPCLSPETASAARIGGPLLSRSLQG